MADGGQPVGDGEGRSALHERRQRPLDKFFRFRVDR